MSVTYPDQTQPFNDRLEAPHAEVTQDAPFVPVYARRGKARGGQGKIRTWMILTPVAVVALGGLGAMMLMQGPEEATVPLAEPALTAPVLSASPTGSALAPLTTASTPAPIVTEPAAAPVARDAAPLRRATPAPAPRQAAPAATPRAVTPAPAVNTGPQAYTPAPAAPSTTTLNTAPVTAAPATPALAPTPPVIIVEPVG
jgi:hypothetical protein